MTYVAGPPVVLKVRVNTTGSSLIKEKWIMLSVPGTEESVPMYMQIINMIFIIK